MADRTTLELRVLHTDEYKMLLAKGHHPETQFVAACEAWNGGPLEGWGRVRHGWHRTIPCKNREFQYTVWPAKQGDRGAYPTTTVIDDLQYDLGEAHRG
ncbi:hypothetical protein [Rubrivivax gelatinosus]|uniref:hypothetical protein n=1 Tax=Rubrivivax gelatinosus TaxID=28068 RepID=UPI0005C17779|nr:hypothetical protein [Rubrivivax gelatinosus]MBG6083165.1 hypothetical protein [Rubrivivax gelatinosus]